MKEYIESPNPEIVVQTLHPKPDSSETPQWSIAERGVLADSGATGTDETPTIHFQKFNHRYTKRVTKGRRV
jgi:hypothetical protein